MLINSSGRFLFVRIPELLVALCLYAAAILPLAAQSMESEHEAVESEWIADKTKTSAMTAALELEAVINAKVINYAQAAYFVLSSANGNSDFTPDNAFRFALDRGWLPKKAATDASIKLGDLSFLIMKSFNLKSGFLYAIFPGSRYAFREMVSLNIIQGTTDPSMTISGERFLLILGNVLKNTGDEL